MYSLCSVQLHSISTILGQLQHYRMTWSSCNLPFSMYLSCSATLVIFSMTDKVRHHTYHTCHIRIIRIIHKDIIQITINQVVKLVKINLVLRELILVWILSTVHTPSYYLSSPFVFATSNAVQVCGKNYSFQHPKSFLANCEFFCLGTPLATWRVPLCSNSIYNHTSTISNSMGECDQGHNWLYAALHCTLPVRVLLSDRTENRDRICLWTQTRSGDLLLGLWLD